MQPAGIVISVQDINGHQTNFSEDTSLGLVQTSPTLHTEQHRTSSDDIAIGGLKERDKDIQSGNSGEDRSKDACTQDEGGVGLATDEKRVALTMKEDGQYEISVESHGDSEEPLTLGKVNAYHTVVLCLRHLSF